MCAILLLNVIVINSSHIDVKGHVNKFRLLSLNIFSLMHVVNTLFLKVVCNIT